MVLELARQARAIFDAGIAAADPFGATRRALSDKGVLAEGRTVHIVAAGKAAGPMMEGALAALGDHAGGRKIVVTNYENAEKLSLSGCEIFAAGHPLPDENGAAAARVIETLALDAGVGETFLFLVSGGASALLPAPAEGVSLAEKIVATDLLLKSGADIRQMNTVRKALSRLKGGGLARAIHPAQGVALILSDVPGDDLDIIASGPTVPDTAAPGDALGVVLAASLTESMPESVIKALRRHAASAPSDLTHWPVENRLVGSNRISLSAMEVAAASAGFTRIVLSEWLEGDVDAAARMIVDAAASAPEGRVALLAGGETSVHVTGNGKGGRNQELALRVAKHMAVDDSSRPWIFLSGGTDGRDGPTDAAGGLTGPETLGALAAAGLSIEKVLADNDAYTGLKAVGGLVMTGATGTNVADLQVMLLA